MTLLVLLATLNGVFTVLTRSEISHVTELDQVEARLVAAIRVEERLQSARANQVLAIRAYALTGEEEFLRDYRADQREERGRHRRLAALLEQEPALLARANAVEEAMSAWNDRLAAPVIEAAPDERADVGAELVGAVGEPLYTRVRDLADALVLALASRQRETTSAVQAARDRLNLQLLTMSLLTLLLIAVSVWAMRQWITRPVAVLSSQAERVAGGDLDAHIRGVGPAEFERIGETMEQMRLRIVSELRTAQQAVEALEQRAPLVSSMRAQLQASSHTDLPAGMEVAATLEPAYGVLAGDWYDVLRIDEDRAALVVVDVSGHGAEAGLRALWLKHLLVPAVRMGLEPGDALNWVAGEVGDTGEWFATCVIIEIDASTGTCHYANAGHPPPLLFGPAGIEELTVTGALFGPIAGERWRTGETVLGAGQMLVVYTDGIIEARNDAGEEFGSERLVSCLLAGSLRDAQALKDDVMNTVHDFGSQRLKDDATLAVIACSGRGATSSSAPATARRLRVP